MFSFSPSNLFSECGKLYDFSSLTLWFWLLGAACLFSHWRSTQSSLVQSIPIQSNRIQFDLIHLFFLCVCGGDLYEHQEFKCTGGRYTRLSAAQLIKYHGTGAVSLPLCFHLRPRNMVSRYFPASQIMLYNSQILYITDFFNLLRHALLPLPANWNQRTCFPSLILTLPPRTCLYLCPSFQPFRLHFLLPRLGLVETASFGRFFFQVHRQRYA